MREVKGGGKEVGERKKKGQKGERWTGWGRKVRKKEERKMKEGS